MSEKHVRELHSRFGLYVECDHEHQEGEAGVVEIDDVGLVCEDGLLQWVCRECDTTDGETTEYSDYGKWPCDTIIALDKPDE